MASSSGASRENRKSTDSDPAKEKRSSLKMKKTPQDFIFGKIIGEGSYSTVFLAKEVSSGKEYAIKVLEKQHILKERKSEYVMREKEVFSKLNHPFFVRLYYTFQDTTRLYFVLTYAPRGELLDYIHKLGSFDENCTRFYAAEVVLALEHLYSLNIIHRDLKPENILMSDQMHIQITDFGSAKLLKEHSDTTDNKDEQSKHPQRRNSFVGTAQYVSPEVLTSKNTYFSSDLWALGAIIYQLLSGLPPFRGSHDYQIFQKIIKLEYEFPDGFCPKARDLVEKLLVIDPTKRLGCPEMGGYTQLKAHPFFEGIDWENLQKEQPPDLIPYLPANTNDSCNLWSTYKVGLDEEQLSRLFGMGVGIGATENDSDSMSDDERSRRLQEQAQNNKYHKYVEGNYIIKQGLIDKRKGLFARRRMFLLTEGPHLYYVDPVNMVYKGEVPWSRELRPEAKNFKIFFIHTPNRTYYLEDPEGYALKWIDEINKVWLRYYGPVTPKRK